MEKIRRSFGVWVMRWLVFASSSYSLTVLALAFAPHGLPNILYASEIGEEIRFVFGLSVVLLLVGTVAMFAAGENQTMKALSSVAFMIALLGLPAVYVKIAY